ncbi:hypothetical protein [Vibrio litoralis]|uniref:hypothetical protein n=1 Tax=Vibrio litoralis TaxID=335972 RepID=UPI0018673CFF|nr:hypothetical protein [Vibrio litoralis]
MKSLIVLLSSLALGAAAFESPKKYDMFLFDNPFLIGQWHVINPAPETIPEDFLSITLELESNYQFGIQIQRKDRTVHSWSGEYSIDDSEIVLGVESESPQTYQYTVNPNQLLLNGVAFSKTVPEHLSGYWRSTEVRGSDVESSFVSDIDLVLYPNFYFSIQSFTSKGSNKYRDGIYYIEDNYIYFIYNDGEQASQYALNSQQLVLSSQDADMYIAFQRSSLH